MIKIKCWNKIDKIFESTMNMPILPMDESDEKVWTFGRINDNYEFIQLTGLTDKNGIEIYEGDILNFRYKGTWEINQKVFFENGCFKVDNGILIQWMDDIEVVGNIYENPELLKDKE